jgi:leader peptidase (prepilin peptidase) / N-methyltransferase
MIALLVLVAVLGLAVGSFLNVVIHRVPRDESVIRPASHCPSCDTVIKARHNVPVLGWLALRGKAACCGVAISFRYPLVEALTAVLFVAVTLRFGFTAELPAYLYLAAISIALAAIDLDVYRLPNAIVLPSYAVAAVLLVPACIVDGTGAPAIRALIAMAALWLFYFGLRAAYPKGMGFGDVKLAGLLGLYLGWLGWSSVAVGAFAAFLVGGIVGVALMSLRRAGRRTAIPFGPAMLAGAFLAVFAAAPLANWYASLTGLTA